MKRTFEQAYLRHREVLHFVRNIAASERQRRPKRRGLGQRAFALFVRGQVNGGRCRRLLRC